MVNHRAVRVAEHPHEQPKLVQPRLAERQLHAFDLTSEIVRTQGTPERWKDLKFLVFDAPDEKGPFEDRVKFLQDNHGKWKSSYTPRG